MILRRVIDHFRKQEWTAIAIDFLIVVAGVFVGMQVSNWNERRAFREREFELLQDLSSDIEAQNATLRSRRDEYREVSAAGERALAILTGGTACLENCGAIIVDLLHASQWQSARLSQSTFAEMRRLGLPTSRNVRAAVEDYYRQNESMSNALDEKPAYRTLVRRLIPLSIQRAYWSNCYELEAGDESLALDCPLGVSNEEAAHVIAVIAAAPQTLGTLTEWTGFLTPVPRLLESEEMAGEKAINEIRRELQDRR